MYEKQRVFVVFHGLEGVWRDLDGHFGWSWPQVCWLTDCGLAVQFNRGCGCCQGGCSQAPQIQSTCPGEGIFCFQAPQIQSTCPGEGIFSFPGGYYYNLQITYFQKPFQQRQNQDEQFSLRILLAKYVHSARTLSRPGHIPFVDAAFLPFWFIGNVRKFSELNSFF